MTEEQINKHFSEIVSYGEKMAAATYQKEWNNLKEHLENKGFTVPKILEESIKEVFKQGYFMGIVRGIEDTVIRYNSNENTQECDA